MGHRGLFGMLMVGVAGVACAAGEDGDDAAGGTALALTWEGVQDSTDRVASVTGLAGPEAVRYDPDQDVYFVSNFNGDGGERDANGFISRVSAEGAIETRQFMTGTAEAPLHAPRGMNITGDTLWVADVDGIHGFDRRSGTHLTFVDLSSFTPGFLNDIAVGPEGALYVTDTGSPGRLLRVSGEGAEIAIEDPALGPPNGITWDEARSWFVIVPWGPGGNIVAWRPGGGELEPLAAAPAGQLDGVEVVAGQVVVASQSDTRLHVVDNGELREIIILPGRPADIGVDTQRMRVAVPYISLNRVDIWELH